MSWKGGNTLFLSEIKHERNIKIGKKGRIKKDKKRESGGRRRPPDSLI